MPIPYLPLGLDAGCAVEWGDGLCAGLLARYKVAPLGHPSYFGGATLFDLCKRVNLSLGTSSTAPSWSGCNGHPSGSGGTLTFDGSDDVAQSAAGTLVLSYPFTVLGWFRVTASTGGGGGATATHWFNQDPADNFNWWAAGPGVFADGWQSYNFGTRGSGGQTSFGVNVPGGRIAFGEWAFVACVGASATSRAIYLKSRRDIDWASNTDTGSNAPTTSSSWIFSIGNDPISSSQGNQFAGDIDDTWVFARDLGEAEIREIYEDTLLGCPRTLRKVSRTAWFTQTSGGGTAFDRSYSDNLGTQDAFSRTSNALRSYTDLLGLADAFARTSAANRQQTDLVGLTDTFSRVSAGNRQYSDSLGESDAYARVSDALRNFSDLLGLTDTATLVLVGAGVFTINVTELLGVTDAYSRLSNALRNFTDTLGIADTATLVLIAGGTFAIAVVELLGTRDVFSRVSDGNRALSDTTGLADAYSRVANTLRSLSDSMGIQDAYARVASALRVITDLLGLHDDVDTQTLIILAAIMLTGNAQRNVMPTGAGQRNVMLTNEGRVGS